MTPAIKISPKPTLSLGQKLLILPEILRVISSTVIALFTAPFRGSSGAPRYTKHVIYHMIRTLCARLSAEQAQYLCPSTDETYGQLVRARRFPAESIFLPDGTKAHWIGSSAAERVMIYLHGGGYNLPANPAQTAIIWGIKNLLEKQGHEVAGLLLSYDLAPGSPYPRQLEQAVSLLRHLLIELGKNPSNIIFVGDSAGGNLALAVLSHLSHPHPNIPEIELSEKFKGAVLMSPWVSFATSSPAMKANQYKDCLKDDVLEYWAKNFMGNAEINPYNQPLTASSEWWSNLKVGEILVVAGADELLVDDIRDFGKKLKAGHEATTVIITDGEAHDQMMIDQQFGYLEDGEQAKAVKSWLSARL